MTDLALQAEVHRLTLRLAELREEQHRRLLRPYTEIRQGRLRNETPGPCDETGRLGDDAHRAEDTVHFVLVETANAQCQAVSSLDSTSPLST